MVKSRTDLQRNKDWRDKDWKKEMDKLSGGNAAIFDRRKKKETERRFVLNVVASDATGIPMDSMIDDESDLDCDSSVPKSKQVDDEDSDSDDACSEESSDSDSDSDDSDSDSFDDSDIEDDDDEDNNNNKNNNTDAAAAAAAPTGANAKPTPKKSTAKANLKPQIITVSEIDNCSRGRVDHHREQKKPGETQVPLSPIEKTRRKGAREVRKILANIRQETQAELQKKFDKIKEENEGLENLNLVIGRNNQLNLQVTMNVCASGEELNQASQVTIEELRNKLHSAHSRIGGLKSSSSIEEQADKRKIAALEEEAATNWRLYKQCLADKKKEQDKLLEKEKEWAAQIGIVEGNPANCDRSSKQQQFDFKEGELLRELRDELKKSAAAKGVLKGSPLEKLNNLLDYIKKFFQPTLSFEQLPDNVRDAPETTVVLNHQAQHGILTWSQVAQLKGYGSPLSAQQALPRAAVTAQEKLAKGDGLSEDMKKLKDFVSNLVELRLEGKIAHRITSKYIYQLLSNPDISHLFPVRSRSSILKVCKELKIKYLLPKSKLALSDRDKELRRRMCKALLKQGENCKYDLFKEGFVFSDESAFRRHGGYARELQIEGRRRVVPLMKAISEHLMVWAAISAEEGIVCYKIYPKNTKIDGHEYTGTLKDAYVPKAKEFFEYWKQKGLLKFKVLVEDNAGCHFTVESQNLFAKLPFMKSISWTDETFKKEKAAWLEKIRQEVTLSRANARRPRADADDDQPAPPQTNKNAARRPPQKKQKQKQQEQQEQQQEEFTKDVTTPMFFSYGWAPHSPDLNPIELFWRYMKARIMAELGHNPPLSALQHKIEEIFKCPKANEKAKEYSRRFKETLEKCLEKEGDVVSDKDLKKPSTNKD